MSGCFRRVDQKSRLDARELTDAISARPPPGLLVEASLPGAAALGGLADVVVDALADGAGFSMHGIVAASRFTAIAATTRKQTRRHAPLFFAEPDCGSSGARSSRPKTRCRTSWIGYWLYRPIETDLEGAAKWGPGGFDSSLREARAVAACARCLG